MDAGKTNLAEPDLQPDDPGITDRGRVLIRIGRVGIATEDRAATQTYFHPTSASTVQAAPSWTRGRAHRHA